MLLFLCFVVDWTGTKQWLFFTHLSRAFYAHIWIYSIGVSVALVRILPRFLYIPASGRSPVRTRFSMSRKALCKLLGYVEGWRGTSIPSFT